MTTAGRPTWNAAKGSDHQGGRTFVPSKKYSARDMPGHTHLKLRQPGQHTQDEVASIDLVSQLLTREGKDTVPITSKQDTKLLTAAAPTTTTTETTTTRDTPEPPDEEKVKKPPKSIDADDSDSEEEEASDKNEKPIAGTKRPPPNAGAEDGDKNKDKDDDDDDDDDDDESSGSEDETEALMQELERIKRERAEDQARREAEERQNAEENRTASMMHSNPLLEATAEDFVVKKKWFDDVVFKNQTRGEPMRKKRFINDTLRNDFHQQFLKKYIR